MNPKRYQFLLAFLFACVLAHAQVPQTLSYQGLLTDATGNPLNGTQNVKFNFYTVATGGTVAFSRGPLEVAAFQGLFTVILGNGQGENNAGLPNLGSTQYYIGIRVGASTTDLSPRVQLTAVPYAFTASNLDPNATVSATQIGAGIDASKITTGILDGSKVSVTNINASNISNGTLPASVIPATVGAPIGSITAFAGPLANIPTGWLECDGRSLSTTAYPALYAAIGNTWGAADGTQFNIPYLLGYFLRGWSHGSGQDPDAASRAPQGNPGSTGSGDNVGSFQNDELKSHQHMQQQARWYWGGGYFADQAQTSTTGSGQAVTGLYTLLAGGNETRPKNAYVIYIIKAQ